MAGVTGVTNWQRPRWPLESEATRAMRAIPAVRVGDAGDVAGMILSLGPAIS